MDRPRESRTAGTPEPVRWRGYGRGPRHLLTIGLLLLGGTLLVSHLGSVDWRAMREVMGDLSYRSLGRAALLGAASYAVYCSFDLLAQRTTGHPLTRGHVLAIAFVGHACALSLGPAGAGVRFRLYAHHGVPAHLTAALWLFNVFTNWLGFATLAGVALATRVVALPPDWGLAGLPLQWFGVALLGAVCLYLVACRLARDHRLVLRGVTFRLPPLPVAAAQCGLSSLNWLLLAGVLHALLGERVPFESVLLALMASALALAIIDVPAGLGVLETVFVALLSPQVPATEVLGALLAYRAIYFVGPLLLASVVYLALEWDAVTAGRRWRGERSRPNWPGEPRPRPRRLS
ncbi:YbhN family protein [Piscinibacter sp. XHJ-5]|uniref:lysylphosphatidylglycerol synthase transmembrane domain-containing protein n=1 Tax=Piscinibacter sp. XHJ-5 TaxID=3037797 RepID=UPI002452CC05|nr:YbhN family protein [Piscinibacter sp. XHJ-5]